MSRLGQVVAADGSRAVVATSRRGVCEGCSSKSSCSFENALGKDRPEEIEVENLIGARPGDYVEFDLPGHAELKVSLLVWVVPLAGLVAGAAAGATVHHLLRMARDPATLLGAAVGFLASFSLVKLYDRRAARDSRLLPRILKTVSPAVCEHPPQAESDR